MPSKKQTRRKLDLTHLGSLNSSVSPEPAKVEPEKVKQEKVEPEKVKQEKVEPAKAEVVKVEPAKAEVVKVEPAKAEVVKVEPAKAEVVKVEVVKIEPQKRVEEEPAASEIVETPAPPPVAAAEPKAEASAETRQFDRRPQRYEPKPLQTLETATNAAGESFQLGDKIQLFAPWGKKAIAEVSLIYQDESQNVWVQYFPIEEIPHNWSWLGGCSRAERLVAAS